MLKKEKISEKILAKQVDVSFEIRNHSILSFEIMRIQFGWMGNKRNKK